MKLKFKVDKKIILKEFLKLQNISKKTLTRIKFDNGGSIKVNNKEQNVRFLLKSQDIVEIELPKEKFSKNVRFIDENFSILYEDEFFIIVDKTANLPTIPSRNNSDKSLLEIINYYFSQKNYQTIPHIVTRLDKNTTGLVIIAKHRHIHSLFSKINIDKYYLALAEGKTPKFKIIEAKIERENNSIITRKISNTGDYAKTELTTLKFLEKKNLSLIKLKLFTGRTHQIRVHCQYIGHSLIGDDLYGGNKKYINRQALHCHNLKFIHPITKKEINMISELPKDISNILTDNYDL